MGIETQKLKNDIIDLFELALIAIFLIVVLFLVIKQLVGEVPAYIASVIVGLGAIFLYATNKKIREHINNWSNLKQQKGK